MSDLVAAVWEGRVVVVDSPDGPVLPQVTGAEGWPDVDQLARAAEVAPGGPLAPTVWLRREPRLTLHPLRLAEPPLRHRTLGLRRLDRLAHPPEVAAAVASAVATFEGSAPWPARREAWFRAGWAEATEAWVDATLADHGLHRAGPLRWLKAWTLSAVAEVPLAGRGQPSAFLKASCAHFGSEAAVTAWLAGLAVDAGLAPSVPEVLGHRAEGSLLLMRPLGLVQRDPSAAPEAARVLARLQLAAMDRVAELRTLGVTDRGPAPTLAAVQALAADHPELERLSEDERKRLPAVVERLAGSLAALETTGLPLTLAHGDLHVGNYAVDDGAVRLFDWSDAALTSPILDVAHLAASAGPEHASAVVAAHAEVWRRARPDDDHATAVRLAPLVDAAYQAQTYAAISRAGEQVAQPAMGGMVARSLQHLLTLDAQLG